MQTTAPRAGTRKTRSKATYAATKKTGAAPEEDTPTVRQRLAEARRSGVLDLRGLNLANIPVDAEKLSKISALLLGNNRFTSIPANLADMFPHLTYLDLSGNKIGNIPSTLAEVHDLEILDLEGNQDIGRRIPASLRPLIDMGKLAIFTEDANITAADMEEVETSASEAEPEELFEPGEVKDRESEQAWRKEYYDTDEEAEVEEGGYEDEVEEEMVSGEPSDGSAESAGSDTLATDNYKIEFKLFLHRVAGLTESDTLESTFRRRWGTGDAIFVRYIAKRYAADAGKQITHGAIGLRKKDRKGEEGSPKISDEEADSRSPKDKNAKRQRDYARKMKEREIGKDLQASRKSKGMRMDVEP